MISRLQADQQGPDIELQVQGESHQFFDRVCVNGSSASSITLSLDLAQSSTPGKSADERKTSENDKSSRRRTVLQLRIPLEQQQIPGTQQQGCQEHLAGLAAIKPQWWAEYRTSRRSPETVNLGSGDQARWQPDLLIKQKGSGGRGLISKYPQMLPISAVRETIDKDACMPLKQYNHATQPSRNVVS